MPLLAGLSPAQSGHRTNDPDLQEMRDYRLNMDVIERYVAVARKVGNDPAAKKCFEHNPPGNAPNLDAGEKLINACAAAVADLKTANIKAREFLIITGALIGDMMAVGMKKSGTIKQYPDSLSPENAAFVEHNFEKLQAMLTPLSDNGK